MEKQLIGQCHSCGVNVYCDGGFLQGIIRPDHQLVCMECDERVSLEALKKEQEERNQEQI